MNIAYVKVSDTEKEENRAIQIDILKEYDIDVWYLETLSINDNNKPQLEQILKFAKANDNIYILSLDVSVK